MVRVKQPGSKLGKSVGQLVTYHVICHREALPIVHLAAVLESICVRAGATGKAEINGGFKG